MRHYQQRESAWLLRRQSGVCSSWWSLHKRRRRCDSTDQQKRPAHEATGEIYVCRESCATSRQQITSNLRWRETNKLVSVRVARQQCASRAHYLVRQHAGRFLTSMCSIRCLVVTSEVSFESHASRPAADAWFRPATHCWGVSPVHSAERNGAGGDRCWWHPHSAPIECGRARVRESRTSGRDRSGTARRGSRLAAVLGG